MASLENVWQSSSEGGKARAGDESYQTDPNYSHNLTDLVLQKLLANQIIEIDCLM